MPATVDIVAALSRRQLLAGGLVLTAGCAAEQAAPAPPGAPYAAALAKLRFAFASPTGSGAWWLYGPDGKIAPENAELTKTAMWKRLPAVRAGRVYPIPYGTSSPGTAITLLDAFDRLLGPLA